MEKYTLIITEKPDAAQRIAQALDHEGKPKKIEEKGVPYFLAHRGRKLVVVPASDTYTRLFTKGEEETTIPFLALSGHHGM